MKTNRADRPAKDGTVYLREWLDFVVERVPQVDREEVETRETSNEKAGNGKITRQKADRSSEFSGAKSLYRHEREYEPFVVSRTTSPNKSSELRSKSSPIGDETKQ